MKAISLLSMSKNIFRKKSLMSISNRFSYIKSKFSFTTTPVPQPAAPRKHGNLKDQDRIFTNLYRDGDVFVEGALKRVKILSNLI